MMGLRTVIALARVMALIVSGFFENLGIVCHRTSGALDWVKDKLQDLMDMVT